MGEFFDKLYFNEVIFNKEYMNVEIYIIFMTETR